MRKIIILLAFLVSQNISAQLDKSSDLYKTILKLDKELFDAYNTCTENLDKHAAFYADNIEFFHDMGGLETSKENLIKSIENNICGKVTRELVRDSVKMHKIPNYGIIVTGYHKFHNLVEKSVSKPSKFIVFWKEIDKNWKITKVVSLH